MLMIRNASITCGRQHMATIRAASTATVAAAKDHKPHQAGTHHHVRAAHHVTCVTQTLKYHLKPEVREVQFLKWCRRIMPQFIHLAQGKLLGVPGPRGVFFRDDKTQEYTSMNFWESAEAINTITQKAEHQKIMSEFHGYGDLDTVVEEVHPHTDIFYFASMQQCNWERYPIEVGHWPVHKGTRQQSAKILAENKKFLHWAHDSGCLVLVLKYNEAQDHCISYAVFKDLLKWEAAHVDFGHKLTEWGFAEIVTVPDLNAVELPAPHSNAWVYSE